MYITGRAFGFALAGLIPTIALESGAVAWAWAGLTLFLCLLDAGLSPSPRGIGVRRDAPASVRLSESTSSQITILNLARRPVRGTIRDAWPPSAGATQNRFDFTLGIDESDHFNTELVPTRRGDRVAGDVTLRLLGPMGLAGRQLSVDVPAHTRVLPEFASRKHLPSRLARLRELDGKSAVQIRGAGSEFDSLREYVMGDDVRSIDWRATARRNDVVVRTWRPERDRHVFIMLDTSRTAAARIGNTPRLDASIEAALLLSALASHAGDRVQIVAFDREARTRVSGLTGSALMPAVADRLAPIDPLLVEMDWIAAFQEIRGAINQRALVVLLTALDPAAAESGLLRAVAPLTRKHQVLVASVSDPEHARLLAGRRDILEIYGAAAATRAELERQAMAVRLRNQGAEVVNAGPDELAPAVADAYIALKAAGKL